MSTPTLEQELEEAAVQAGAFAVLYDGAVRDDYLRWARRFRQRAAWVRELEAGAHPNGSLDAIRLLIGPNMSLGEVSAAETAPTERKEP